MLSSRTRMVRAIGFAAVLTAGSSLFTFTAHSSSLSLAETGSTLILPLFKAWASGYAKVDPDLHMTLGGIFTPTILASALGKEADHVRSLSDLIANDILAARGAAMITVLLIVGIAFAVLLADKLGRIRLQIIGFVGCAVGLLLASVSVDVSGGLKTILIFAGFMLFNFMTNLGPNAQTYLLAGEVFPTAIRGKGAGFAAAFAKIGAVATAFLFPILLVTIGTRLLLYSLIVASLLGAVVTWMYRIETTGVNLDRIGEVASEPEAARKAVA